MTLADYLATAEGRCQHGYAKVQHPSLCACAGIAAKAKGQAITTAAHPAERAKVEAAVRKLAATGRPFSANSARPLHGVSGPVVGAVFSALASEGLIRRVGYVASTEPGTHGHPVAEWVAA